MKGQIVSLNISEKMGTVKTPVGQVMFVENFGIEGDAHGGSWHRQVSLLAQESIDKMIAKSSLDLNSGAFAENITTLGLELYTLPIGTKFKIGESIQELTQIGKECHSGCEIQQKSGQCIMPKEGIFTRVLKGGAARAGDVIEVIEP